MQNIDLNKIIKQNNLEAPEVAKQLFPKNKFPALALARVIRGEAFLDSQQLSKLSLMANIRIEELFGLSWKSIKKGDILTLSSGEFKAELDTKTWITKIFDKKSLFHEIIIHNGSTPLNKYLYTINVVIADYKNKVK